MSTERSNESWIISLASGLQHSADMPRSFGMLFAVFTWPPASDTIGRRKVLMFSLFMTSLLFGLQAVAEKCGFSRFFWKCLMQCLKRMTSIWNLSDCETKPFSAPSRCGCCNSTSRSMCSWSCAFARVFLQVAIRSSRPASQHGRHSSCENSHLIFLNKMISAHRLGLPGRCGAFGPLAGFHGPSWGFSDAGLHHRTHPGWLPVHHRTLTYQPKDSKACQIHTVSMFK